MKFKLGKMETPKLYYVMCRFCDGDTKDNDIFINCYLKKESAFKLRNLLNEINEYDADYFVKFEDKEIKTLEE